MGLGGQMSPAKLKIHSVDAPSKNGRPKQFYNYEKFSLFGIICNKVQLYKVEIKTRKIIRGARGDSEPSSATSRHNMHERTDKPVS